MMAPLLLAAVLANQPPAKPAAVQAAELCTQVARVGSFNLEPLAAAGWTEAWTRGRLRGATAPTPARPPAGDPTSRYGVEVPAVDSVPAAEIAR